jgi:hypothetical protein
MEWYANDDWALHEDAPALLPKRVYLLVVFLDFVYFYFLHGLISDKVVNGAMKEIGYALHILQIARRAYAIRPAIDAHVGQTDILRNGVKVVSLLARYSHQAVHRLEFNFPNAHKNASCVILEGNTLPFSIRLKKKAISNLLLIILGALYYRKRYILTRYFNPRSSSEVQSRIRQSSFTWKMEGSESPFSQRQTVTWLTPSVSAMKPCLIFFAFLISESLISTLFFFIVISS